MMATLYRDNSVFPLTDFYVLPDEMREDETTRVFAAEWEFFVREVAMFIAVSQHGSGRVTKTYFPNETPDRMVWEVSVQ